MQYTVTVAVALFNFGNVAATAAEMFRIISNYVMVLSASCDQGTKN